MSRVETIGNATLYLGDCLETIRTLPDCSVDSIVTDPPYGLGKEPDALAMLADWLASGHHDVKGSGFMGKAWDAFVPQPALWRECLRVLKPGGHLLAFAGTRTHDLMTLGLRIAGFEIRDTIMWVYGSGFPKSLDVSKAVDATILHGGSGSRQIKKTIDGRPGEARVTGLLPNNWIMSGEMRGGATNDNPATDAARQWQGWGTALKPALEPITLARKPLDGTVATNVLAHGTGALNIDGCRVGSDAGWSYPNGRGGSGWHGRESLSGNLTEPMAATQGRWPANLIHDGSDEVVSRFPAAGGGFGKRGGRDAATVGEFGMGSTMEVVGYGDAGSAARFFYCAKASKRDRDEGLEGFVLASAGEMTGGCEEGSAGLNNPRAGAGRTGGGRNIHPTVKPTDLMRYLCRLVTPPGGVVLDPFMGSGSTGKAAMFEGFRFIGCELDPDYAAIARARIAATEQRVAADRRRIEDAQRQGRLIE